MTEAQFPEAQQARKSQRLPATQAQLYAAAGIVLGILFPVSATLVKVMEQRLPLNLSNFIAAQQGELLLWIMDTAPLFLGFIAGLAGRRQDALIETNKKLVEQEKEITSIQAGLEQRVAERTRELENRNLQMGIAVRFSREISETQDSSTLLSKAVELVSERFGYYHVNIFLLDEQHRKAFLQASSFKEGKVMLEQGHYVAVGDASIVGRAADQGKTIRFSEPEGAGLSNPEAPRAEAAIPLVVRGKVSGVLDIQSERADAFGQSEIEILQLLADQIAASMENIRLLNESQAIVSQLEVLTSQQTRAAWRAYLQGTNIAYQFTTAGVRPATANAKPQNTNGLRIPLVLRGQAIGSIVLHRQDTSRWSDSERDLAEKIAAQVSLALDNSRLLDETRQRALQEQTVNEISARLSRSLDIDALLQTAARELGSLPEVAEVSVFVGDAKEPDADKKSNRRGR